MPRLKTDSHTTKTPAGALRLDGSWDDDGDPNSPLMSTVRELLSCRQVDTPAALAARIRSSHFAATWQESDLTQWGTLVERHLWPGAKCSTTSAELIKRCGKGQNGHWDESSILWQANQL